jgi:hypothetical protein
MLMRTLALPALAASVVLSLSACDPTNPAPQSAGATPAASLAVATPSDGSLADTSAVTANAPVTLVAPAADRTPAGPSATPSAGASATAAARPTASGAPTGSAAPAPSGTPVVAAGAADLKLASYDQKTGAAVLAATDNGKGGAPSPSATAAVQPGQLIDSPPTAAAPHGALLKVTGVKPAGAGKVAVATRPASISELLGNAWADIKSALDPHKIQVTPQLKDVKASYVPNPDGGNGSASAALELDANDSVPLPGGASATLDGSIELDPSVLFSYQGANGILAADRAKVGFDLGAHANWHLTAALTGSTGQVKIPIATLTATPTVMVGEVPVVITLNLTVYAEVSADGTVTVDTTQSVDGDWAVHADYTKAGGWTGTTEPVTTKISPVRATFSGTADVRSGLVADGSVALYDTVGVKATIEPYLKAAVDGSVTVDSSGGTPQVTGKAALSGGLDVNGAIMARIAILGTPLIEKDLSFPLYHDEWPIVSASYSNSNTKAGVAQSN